MIENLSGKQMIVLTVIATIGVFVVACVLATWVDYFTCSRRWSDFETRFDWIVGCQVKVEGKFVPEQNVRQF